MMVMIAALMIAALGPLQAGLAECLLQGLDAPGFAGVVAG